MKINKNNIIIKKMFKKLDPSTPRSRNKISNLVVMPE